jgi:chromosome segregation ATPase
MAETFWETETAEQAEPQQQQFLQPVEPEAGVQAAPEAAAEPEQAEPQQAAAVALSADEFTALEERILRAVALVKRERASRVEAEERAEQAETQLSEQATATEQMQKELEGLRAERDHVRERVERLLSELDALEL